MAKKNQKTILVTGATGNQGGSVFQHLRKSNKFSLRVLTRDPDKPAARALVGAGVDVVRGDLDDTPSLSRALEDVDGVYSVQDWTGGAEAEVRQGRNLIDASRQQGVSHFVYSSVGAADEKTGIPHFESKFQIEEHLRSSGLPFTIFRPVFFMENWFGSKEQIDGGTLALPLSPETHLQMITVDDIGSFALQAFEKPGRWTGRVEQIAGDDLSMTDIAKDLGTVAGCEVRYQQVPFDAFEKQAGHEMAVMFRWFEDHGYKVDLPTLRQELPSLTNFERWLNTKWQSAPAVAARALDSSNVDYTQGMILRVNGRRRRVDVDPKQTLLSVLRNELDLTGAKYGCGEGQCGACTVLLNSAPAHSCQIECGVVGDREITTIEGLASGDGLHPLQQSFIECDAMQCGYCTSGMILTGAALLRKNPDPSDIEIRSALNGNVCRCGTYNRILAAVHHAAKSVTASAVKEHAE